MQKSLLVCFYDRIGRVTVSYQIYKSAGDFYRSIVSSLSDKSLPFCNFRSDYLVIPVCFLEGSQHLPCDVPSFTFEQAYIASKGMDPNINFNTALFIERLSSVISETSDVYIDYVNDDVDSDDDEVNCEDIVCKE